MIQFLPLIGAVVARAVASRPRPSGGGFRVTWHAVAPHALARFCREYPDAVDPLGLADRLDERGGHDLAAEVRQGYARQAREYPGCRVFIEVHN